MKKHTTALHIFRRDLRLEDNTALLFALRNARDVIPCFVFDPRQIDDHPYRSERALQFMLTSLRELDTSLRIYGSQLYVFNGCSEEVIAEMLRGSRIDLVTINRDYTPFARARDEAIATVCAKQGVSFMCFADTLLTEPEMIHKDDGEPYKVFTPFFRRAREITVASPRKNRHTNYYHQKIPGSVDLVTCTKSISHKNTAMRVMGGRSEGKKLLKKIRSLSQYVPLRDLPSQDHTSHLSAHHKFGTVSIRETYHTIIREHGARHPLIAQLYWRDFFTHIAFHYPHVFGGSFHKKYDAISWRNDAKQFKAWKEGMTGFPIVDAGMRELNATGFMHNRVRMITASFLIKDLLIDWRWGERYFAQKLVDYDPSINNGNWQWAASTGCDAQPYFRIFNPWRQQKTFDLDCRYVKKWIPELQKYTTKEIHALEKSTAPISHYPAQIVDHVQASAHAKAVYRKIVSK